METLVIIRNKLLNLTYRFVLKPIFFRIEPERIHDFMVSTGEFCGRFNLTRMLIRYLFYYSHPALKQKVLGITFENPVGLSAGFDKDARLTGIIKQVGFGFEEVGSVTALPYSGNKGTRLWRLKESKSLVVNYGLKNIGANKISRKLRKMKFDLPVGISIAKTNSLDTVDEKKGVEDYVRGFSHFTNIGHFYTVNISCPNTFGGQPFTSATKLDHLLTELDKIPTQKPVFVKFSPDLSRLEVREILDVCRNHRVHGFVVSNLTKNRNNPRLKDSDIPAIGGISGKVVQNLSDELISYIYNYTRGEFVIIGVGGVFSAEDAYKKIKLGASLVQLITGMIFQGPQSISEINFRLVRLLQKDGYRNISEAVGADIKKTWNLHSGPFVTKDRIRKYTESYPSPFPA